MRETNKKLCEPVEQLIELVILITLISKFKIKEKLTRALWEQIYTRDKQNRKNYYNHGYLTEWKHFSWAARHTRHGVLLITSVDRGSMATGKYPKHFTFYSLTHDWSDEMTSFDRTYQLTHVIGSLNARPIYINQY